MTSFCGDGGAGSVTREQRHERASAWLDTDKVLVSLLASCHAPAMRLFTAALASLCAGLLLTGCMVDKAVVGSYAHPEAGIITLGDDGNGSYIHFEGDLRAVPGDHQEPAPGLYLSGSRDDRRWNDTFIDWRSNDDTVTLLPAGGPAVQATHTEAGLILTVGSGTEAQDLTFVLQTGTCTRSAARSAC